MSLFQSIEDWATHDAWPVVKTFFLGVVKSEVAALAPIAKQAVQDLAVQEIEALKSGKIVDSGPDILGKVVTDTAARAQAAGIEAGANSILTAVGAAVHD